VVGTHETVDGGDAVPVGDGCGDALAADPTAPVLQQHGQVDGAGRGGLHVGELDGVVGVFTYGFDHSDVV